MADLPPSDNTTLLEVLAGYQAEGFTGSFRPVAGALLACDRCGATLPASDLEVRSLRRMEGASDPADMLAVVAASCPRCQARGTLVLGYGPMAEPNDADVLATVHDARYEGRGSLPPGASPNDVPGAARADPVRSSEPD